MFKNSKLWLRSMFCAFQMFSAIALLGATNSADAQEVLTGVYAGNDGGTYYVRHVPERGEVFWFGERADRGWANVYRGTVSTTGFGDRIVFGNWLDVPKGGIMSGGPLNLQFRGSEIALLGAPSEFGSSRWNRIGYQPQRAPHDLMHAPTGPGATGIYFGSDRGIYYVRQNGNDLSWFGEVCSTIRGASPVSGNAYFGTLAGSTATGPWIDTPYGTARNQSTLQVQVEPTRLRGVGTFAGREWRRSTVGPGTMISAVELSIQTGGDDLRGGSVDHVSFQVRGRGLLPEVNLNNGANWPNNSLNRVVVRFAEPVAIRDLLSLSLRHDGAPRNGEIGYDNWNADSITLAFFVAGSACPLQIGAVLTPGRMTGSRTVFTVPINP